MDRVDGLDPTGPAVKTHRGARVAWLLLLLAGRAAVAAPDWPSDLRARLQRIDADFAGEIGVYVHDVETGRSLSFRGEEPWYLASGVKVPVAIAVMRAAERNELALDATIELLDSDYVDGAGSTNLHPPGTLLRVETLLEQMLIHSDNTATDMLIRTVGLERVNRIAQELVSQQGGATITTLADVRRRTYSAFHPDATRLAGRDLLALKQARADDARRALLATLLGVPPSALVPGTVDGAFDAYYAMNLNTAPLRDYAHMLAALVRGHALGPAATNHLLGLLERVETGRRRLRAGLPKTVGFAHKTGTQRRRVCDFGIVTVGASYDARHVVIAACTRGDASLTRSERALRDIGTAVARSGVLQGASDPTGRPP